MSGSLPRIYARLQVSFSESRILTEIARVATPQGHQARISYSALAARTDLSLRWTKELVRRLVERRLLRVDVRVKRRGYNFINVYTLVRVWLRDPTAHMGSERLPHPNPTKRENRGFATHEECLKAGLSPGTIAYNAARGFP